MLLKKTERICHRFTISSYTVAQHHVSHVSEIKNGSNVILIWGVVPHCNVTEVCTTCLWIKKKKELQAMKSGSVYLNCTERKVYKHYITWILIGPSALFQITWIWLPLEPSEKTSFSLETSYTKYYFIFLRNLHLAGLFTRKISQFTAVTGILLFKPPLSAKRQNTFQKWNKRAHWKWYWDPFSFGKGLASLLKLQSHPRPVVFKDWCDMWVLSWHIYT